MEGSILEFSLTSNNLTINLLIIELLSILDVKKFRIRIEPFFNILKKVDDIKVKEQILSILKIYYENNR